MEKSTGTDPVVLLLDNYGKESKKLRDSFRYAGLDIDIVVLSPDGYLPEDVTCVYEYFLGDFSEVPYLKGTPLFFNEVLVPDYWEISGTGRSGKVMDLTKERARIHFAEPKHRRLISAVDWLDEKGVVRSRDHYNKYGALYARTIFNYKGERVHTSYFSPGGKEIIYENHVTGDIILNDRENGQEVTRVFHKKVEFLAFFLKETGLDQGNVFYNSLSTPFFLSLQLDSDRKGDILFWQEPERPDIPGNMQDIFSGNIPRTQKVLVQHRAAYDKLIALGADAEMTAPLGYIYKFTKENSHGTEALICTNSDNIAQLDAIVKALPQVHFHIAALTEMSSKLMSKEAYENVSLYPGVKEKTVDKLFAKCDWYLDINHEGEILDAVNRAFRSNMLLFGFKETLHNRDYIPQQQIFTKAEPEKLIHAVEELLQDVPAQDAVLVRQHAFAMSEDPERYRELVIAATKECRFRYKNEFVETLLSADEYKGDLKTMPQIPEKS